MHGRQTTKGLGVRRKTAFALIGVAGLFLVSPTAAASASGVVLGDPQTQGGGTAVNPGDVYGVADFEVHAPPGGSVSTALTGLMEGLIAKEYGNNQGSYLLTIELQRNGQTLVQKPLISITYSNKQFLFITTSSQSATSTIYNGTLLNTDSLDGSNNDVDVLLKSYYKANSNFDLSLFDTLNDVSASFGIASKLDAVGVTSSLLGSIQKVLQQSLQSSDETQQLFQYRMSFAQVGQVDPSRIRLLVLPITYSYQSGSRWYTGQLNLQVRTWSVSSKFRFDPASGKFVSPSASVILNNATVSQTSPTMSIVDYLQKSGDENVRSFLTTIEGNTAYSGDDIYSKCTELLGAFHKYLGNRDSLALLWATMNEYRVGFKKSNGGACVTGRQADFDNLGLPTAELTAYLTGK